MTAFTLPTTSSFGGSVNAPDPDSLNPSTSDVLVVYQPVFRHHAQSNRRAQSPSRSSPMMSPSPLPGVSEDSSDFMAVAPQQQEHQPVPHQDDDQEQTSLLDPVRSRPIHVLQSTGHEVADCLLTSHLQDRGRTGKTRPEGGSSHGLQVTSTISTSSSSSKSSSSEHTVCIDCISILPASYIRSNHHAFAQNHSTTISRSTSPSGQSPRRNLLSNMRAHSPDRVRHSDSSRSLKDRAAHSRAGSIFANMLHHSHPSSDSLSHAFHLPHPSHLLSSAPASSKADSATASVQSASEQLLDLTDDLRIEDEAGEEAREQILDRLTILAGELQSAANDHKGYSVYVSTDVEQAHDGECLDDAIVRLAQAKGYREIVVVNDVDWATTIEATDAVCTPRRALSVPQSPRNHKDQLLPLPHFTTPGSPASPHGPVIPLTTRSSADHGPDFPFSSHGSSSSASSTRRRSSYTSHEERRSTIGRLFGHHASGLTHALAHDVFHQHHDHHHDSHHHHHHDHNHHHHDHHHHHPHHGHHIHFPSLKFHGLPHPTLSRAARTRERQGQTEVHRLLVTHTQHLARRLHDVKGARVTLL